MQERYHDDENENKLFDTKLEFLLIGIQTNDEGTILDILNEYSNEAHACLKLINQLDPSNKERLVSFADSSGFVSLNMIVNCINHYIEAIHATELHQLKEFQKNFILNMTKSSTTEMVRKISARFIFHLTQAELHKTTGEERAEILKQILQDSIMFINPHPLHRIRQSNYPYLRNQYGSVLSYHNELRAEKHEKSVLTPVTFFGEKKGGKVKEKGKEKEKRTEGSQLTRVTLWPEASSGNEEEEELELAIKLSLGLDSNKRY